MTDRSESPDLTDCQWRVLALLAGPGALALDAEEAEALLHLQGLGLAWHMNATPAGRAALEAS